MSFLDKVKEKVGGYMEGQKKKTVNSELLKKYQDEFYYAQTNYATVETFDDREKLYIGTHGVDENVNDQYPKPNGRPKANNVVNVIYELIESQIDTQIPQPSVRSKWAGRDHQERMIEDSIKNDLMESEIYRINDENERTTPIQGFSIVTVEWNPDIDKHLYRGEIHLDNRHPKCLIPQPGCFKIQDMDYFFLIASVPSSYVKRRWGVDVDTEGEEFPQYSTIDGESDNVGDTENVTVITRWGKDEDGNINKFVWVNDIVLEYYEDYFSRKVTRCSYCYTPFYDEDTKEGEEPCPNCLEKRGVEEYKRISKNEEEEMIEKDYIKKDGTVIPAGTVVKYFKPTRYPIVIRKNVPLPFNFGGQSDVDIIRDQADAIKKVISTIEDKILRGGVIIKADETHRFKPTNDLYQIVKGNPQQLASLQTMDIGSDISKDMAFFAEQYKAAKDTLGITDSFQGKPDTTAQSGKAKMVQVAQSSGRMMSKQFNKKAAFKELFEIMFEFKLAFYDELRPYIQLDATGQPVHGEFNKYEFLERDASGEWYYNTDFLFSAEAGDGIPKDKMWLMNQTLMYVQSGLLDKIQFWSAMEKFGYPGATDYKQKAIEEQQMMMQQQMMQAQQQQQMMQQQGMMQQQQMQQQSQDNEFKKKIEAMKLAQQGAKADAKNQM